MASKSARVGRARGAAWDASVGGPAQQRTPQPGLLLVDPNILDPNRPPAENRERDALAEAGAALEADGGHAYSNQTNNSNISPAHMS